MSARAEELRRSLERPRPESWKPQAGDSIVGRFDRLERGSTIHHPIVWIVVLVDDETGVEQAVWCLHAALWAKIREAAPTIGDLIAIRYEGEGEPDPRAKGKPAHRYRVIVDRPAGTQVDWRRADRAVETGELEGGVMHAPTHGGTFVVETGPSDLERSEVFMGAIGDHSTRPAALDAAEHERVFRGTTELLPVGFRERPEPCQRCHAPWPHHEAGCPDEIPF